jgi:putative transposon-encoded protein
MKIIIIVACILCCLEGRAQKKITYILPDSVEVRINSHILTKSGVKSYYLLLKKDTSRTYNITVIPFDNSAKSEVNNWVNNTDRYALINGQLYPLLFDYDFAFSTPDPNNVGSFGHRDGSIRKLQLIAHRYTIYFRTNGLILKEEDW